MKDQDKLLSQVYLRKYFDWFDMSEVAGCEVVVIFYTFLQNMCLCSV